VDYVLVEGNQSVRRHRVRRVAYVSTDHRMVYVDFAPGEKGAHKQYMEKLQTFPVPPPEGEDMSEADKLFQACLDERRPPQKQAGGQERPSWISDTTWAMIRRKAELRRRRSTRSRKSESQRLKRGIRKGLQTDREARLDKAATEIEAAMQMDTQRGYQLLGRWYKRREGQGLALSTQAMGVVEDEYRTLYARPAQPTGEMIPLDRVRGRYQVPDHIPHDDEIREACRKLRRGKAPGPSGMSGDDLREWEEDEDTTKWDKVVALVQHAFESGETPAAFQAGVLVLVPKSDVGKYRGIALLEALYKLLSALINRRVCKAVKWHDAVHGFITDRSCATAILEVKLAMQMAKRKGQVYHQIFLDLSKAYDNLDRERLYEIMEAYGMGPLTMRLLRNAWEGSGVVPKKAGRFGKFIATDRGVKQGDIASPTFFNMAVDAIIRAEEDVRRRTGDAAAREIAIAFYADDGKIGGTDAGAVQASLDVFTDLFGRMGLKMNGTKTEAMTSATPGRPTQIRHGAYQRKLAGTGAEYKARSSAMGVCPVCGDEIQKRSLARHLRDQHPGVTPPRLDLEDLVSPVRNTRTRKYVIAVGRTGERMPCPDGSCTFGGKTCTAMRVHFMHRHWRDTLDFRGQPGYVKCPECSMMVKSPVSARHQASMICRDGAQRQRSRTQRGIVEQAAAAPAQFSVGPKQLTIVPEFKYLGRVVARDDSDLAACLRNVARARAKWGEISRILRRDGASVGSTARFYVVIVNAVLLFASETWVVTQRIENMLTTFHNKCARIIGHTYIRPKIDAPTEWVYPSVTSSLEAAHLLPLRTYLDRRRAKFREFAQTREIYHRCKMSSSIAQPFPTLWEQLEKTPVDERNPESIFDF
jgi:hypothetical protein